MATSWKALLLHGPHGNQTKNTFPLPFTTSSLSAQSEFVRWVGNDPITADGDSLALYDQVELVTLAFGLAFRALWVAQFPGIYSDVPPYILNSSYPFTEYEQLSHKIENIISGYIDT